MRISSVLLWWAFFLGGFPVATTADGSRAPLVGTRRPLWVGAMGVAALAAGWALWLRTQDSSPFRIFTSEPGSLQGQTMVVTGGTTGLGLESAKRLAAASARVVITARSDTKGIAAVQQIQEYCQLHSPTVECSARVSYKVLDLDDLQTVRESDWTDVDQIDVLMNNAGVLSLYQLELTVDGYERTIQSNHLGHFVLTALLSTKFAPKARIINVSSNAHKAAWRGMRFEMLWKGQKDQTAYGGWNNYAQSKLANILFTQELQRRVDQNPQVQWQTATLHPGAVSTDMLRHFLGADRHERVLRGEAHWLVLALAGFVRRFLKTVEEGASTQVWLAAGAPGFDGQLHGQYFDECREIKLGQFAQDAAAAQRLWQESELMSGVKFNI